ncbi:phosphotyrosine interaction domain protein [Necator americanus]|uniref:Phosphotyrosine interaction domain protein n=1 Tax=Necator americanus TaxID=51031 RepID=W2T8J0_NECAM|nr:phosphotyrosine interaction domain protein [Necator americanus]ETN77944.1 phosphotyrosine interaction domain protein [Necator americanus]
MDRLRRSIRQSFRRGGRHSPENSVPSELVASNVSNGQKQEQWQPDEAAVRAGLCHFSVKITNVLPYSIVLQSNRRRPIKAVLYVSGDGLRVVDQENNRGLIVDQTIEKVSFCAPDRNNDKGFAYICRDGTSRRWMCHGFHATKETGERLSHAVGCAFSICLERKKKRDEENVQSLEKALNPNWEDKDDAAAALQRTNQAYQSFRKQIPISERLQDPQSAIVNTAPLSTAHQPSSSIAKPRPTPNPALFQRQGSLRAPESSSAAQFRRNYSLRVNAQSLDGFPMKPDDVKDEILNRIEQIRRMHSNFRLQLYRPMPLTFGKQSLHNEPIYEGEEENSVQMGTSFSTSPGAAPYANTSPRPTTSSFIAASATAPSTDVFDLIGLGPTPSTSLSADVVNYTVDKDQAASPLQCALSPTPPATVVHPSTALTNGISSGATTNQINVNTNWPTPASTSQYSSRSRADEWLEDAFRTSLTINSPPLPMSPPTDAPVADSSGFQSWQTTSNQSLFDSPVTSGPPPVAPPPPLPSKDVVVNGSLSARSGTGLDAFGQSVQWDPLPATPVSRAEDPFDIQWSRLAAGPTVPSNPFISEVPRELRI